jgi:hypothetical protein
MAEGGLGRHDVVKSDGHTLSPSLRESFALDLRDRQS